MTVVISSTLLAAILADARSDPARERCGLLLGDASRITGFHAAPNVVDDPARTFEIDPATLIAAYRSQRSGGPRIVGHYHSHPHGVARPSATDAADADDQGRLWLIVSPTDVTLWHSQRGGPYLGRFTLLDMRVTSPVSLASPPGAP